MTPVDGPTLAAILVNYNHGHYLNECLNAVLEQSRSADEVVLIDDGSTDNSVEIARALQKLNPALRIVTHESNRGVEAAVATGLRETTSDYVYLGAIDDRIEPGFFEAAMKRLQQFPHAGFCVGMLGYIDYATDMRLPYRPPRWLKPEIPYFSPAQVRREMLRGVTFGGYTAVISRRALNEAGGIRVDLRWYGDWFALNVVAFRNGVCIIPDVVALCRRHPGTYSGRTTGRERRRVIRHMLELLDSNEYIDTRDGFRSGTFHNLLGDGFIVMCSPRYWRWLSWPYLVLRSGSLIVRSWRESRRRISDLIRRRRN